MSGMPRLLIHAGDIPRSSMLMLVNAVLAAMLMAMRAFLPVQRLVGMIGTVHMLMRMRMLMGVGVVVRVRMYHVAMLVLMGMDMGVSVLVHVLMRVAVRLLVVVAVAAVLHVLSPWNDP